MLLQAYDFAHLYRDAGRRAPDGRRRPVGQHHGRPRADPARSRAATRTADDPAHGLAYKLLLRRSGTKFGKTRGGDRSGSTRRGPRRTRSTSTGSNTDDRDVGHVPALVHRADRATRSRRSSRGRGAPEAPAAQRALARDITARTHGEAAAAGRAPIRGVFAGACRSRTRRSSPRSSTSDRRVHVRRRRRSRPGRAVLLAEAGRVRVAGEARRMIAGGGVTINGDARRPIAERRRPGADRRASGSRSASASGPTRDRPPGRRRERVSRMRPVSRQACVALAQRRR